MKLSSRQQLLKEASQVLSELKKEGSNLVYTPAEVDRIKKSIRIVLQLNKDVIADINNSSSALEELEDELLDASSGNSPALVSNANITKFMKRVFGYNQQGKSVSKLMKETQNLIKALGR